MLSLKDKVTEKLSHLFSDSSPSQSPPLDQSQARTYSKEGKSFSSIFSFILPSSSLDGVRSNKNKNDIRPLQSPPVKWKSRNISWQDKPLDYYEECDHKCENKESPNSHGEDQEHGLGRSAECVNKRALNNHEDGDPGSARSTASSDMFEDATDQHNVEKAMPYLTEESSFISSDLYEFFLSSLPNIVKGCQWVLLYSTVKHGISLRTLIRRSADLPGPCLLIVGDKQGAVFGGLVECPLKPTPKRKYQGTNQTFVFTTLYGEPRLFRPTGANRYFYLCLNDLLALGGGGNFALCLDGDLLTGTSGPCETFGNLCLAHSQEFELKNVELWGFAHSSRYLI
ncbi:Oxidation resistance protein [Actinidia chinensis var. chinensis]|uniref:Oxidation resistance protein n=1 Tax=Actinidia chinensis var. chinensis TaxID=1590841 RepID=A0A2R6S037_ACTCC|nr:Oxidation resistance protein [Actinidia chinensis var. chinensis]